MGLYTSRHLTARHTPLPGMFMAFVRWFCRLKVEGREHVPSRGGFLLAANHASHADTAVVFASLQPEQRRSIVAAAAQDYFFDNGVRQYVARVLFNGVPVARRMVRGQDPLRHVVRAIREGYGVLLFPEGTRSATGALGEFRSGIGRLIAEFPGLPIVPTALCGTAEVLPKRAVLPKRQHVTVRFGEPLCGLRADRRDRDTWQRAAEEVRAAVQSLMGSSAPLLAEPS